MPRRFGLIGLGNMGGPMAARMVRAGLDVVVHDVRPEPMGELAALGASAARTPADVADRCDVIVLVVRDDAQVDQVVFADGLLAHMQVGSTLVISSTVLPATCLAVADAAAPGRIDVLDAPISGGEQGARDGTLSVIVGGSPDAVARCRPLFDAIGRETLHIGPVGAGQTAKIVNNMIALVTAQAVREGLRLATCAGIDEHDMLAVAEASTADSWSIRHWHATRDQIERYPGGPAGIAELAAKDLGLALHVGDQLGAALPLTAHAADIVRRVESWSLSAIGGGAAG